MGENYTRYNVGVDATTAARLLDLNRRFYNEHGPAFSETRGRLQEGVLRVVERLHGGEALLDLGCGNGELARALSRRGQRGPYLGLDFSRTLLEIAGSQAFNFPAQFRETDLASFAAATGEVSGMPFDIVLCFAVLHHLPGFELRLRLLKRVRALIKPDGLFIHSNWQFLNSPRLKARIQAWEIIGLSAQQVDPNDYLLDWRRGGSGLRYVHHFDLAELGELAKAGGFEMLETFYLDGEQKRLGVYQIWKAASA